MSDSRFLDLVARYRGPIDDIVHACAEVVDLRGDDSSIARLREVVGVVGLAAELAKKDAERKRIHQMLNDAGIPETSAGSGEGICLEGRIALALNRLAR